MKPLFTAACALILGASVALAETAKSEMDHSKMDHSKMSMSAEQMEGAVQTTRLTPSKTIKP